LAAGHIKQTTVIRSAVKVADTQLVVINPKAVAKLKTEI
jgi:hypothetical protein